MTRLTLNLASWKWPLRRQIAVLGLMVLTTVMLTTVFAVEVHRQTEATRVADAQHQLDRAMGQLDERFHHLRDSFREHQVADPLESGDDELLRKFTEVTLAGAPGVEGGFFSTETRQLLGYAFPTYQGTGPKTDIPPAERPTILKVVDAAITANARAAEQVEAGTDVILFRAQPLLEDGQTVGAVWLMQRLIGLHSARQRLYGIGLLILLGASSTIAAGAWWITRRLDHGVSGIEKGLQAMEDRLETPVPSVGIPELDRISTAINRLAHALLETQARRSELEQSLRQSERLAALGRLVAGLAHEIRNPLASIKLKLHLAHKDLADTERLMRAFEVVQTEVNRLDRLVERMLSLAKPSEPSLLATNLSSFLAELLDLWRARAATQSTELKLLQTDSGSQPVLLDRDSVGQILDNLVANSLEALADQGGSIAVEIKSLAPTGIVIGVADTGPGVPPEAVAQLFEPFFTTRKGGTGLGLFLSAEIARRLGGSIEYHSCPTGGACFEVRIPC